MRAYLAFTKKEFIEAVRTYRLLILAAVFLLFGMMNPITAKITPRLLESLMPEGVQITITEPTAMDSWAQFFKNVPQMGLFVVVILFSGILANEFSRGTLVNMLSKGLPRRVVILSKFSMSAVLWTGAYAMCAGVTAAYTEYFWTGDRVPGVLLAVFGLWLFGILLLSSLMLGGVLFKNGYGSLLSTGGFVVVLFLADFVPGVRDFNPVTLASGSMALLSGKLEAAGFLWPAAAGSLMTVAFLLAAVAAFNRKQV